MTPAMITTYGGVLSAIEKALWELVEEYQGVGKSLRDLVEGQERKHSPIGENWGRDGVEMGFGRREREGGEWR